MARTQWFDPFGQRVAGMQAGIADESKLQADTRQARASDYAYNNFAPIQLADMQRESNYQTYFDPYRRRNAALAEQVGLGNYYDQERPRRQLAAQASGNWALPEILDSARYTPTATTPGAIVQGEPSPAYSAFGDLQALAAQEGIQPGDPLFDQYVQSISQMYGITPEQMFGPEAAQPPTMTQQPTMQYQLNPYTGEMIPFQTAPGSYRQQGFAPQAAQQADFGLRQNYLNLQQSYQQNKAGAAAADTGEGGDTPYYLQ